MAGTRNIAIRMTYEDGSIYQWTVRRVESALNVCIGRKPRKVSGWEFISHDGCTRFSEGSWMELVIAFRRTAANYGMTCNIS